MGKKKKKRKKGHKRFYLLPIPNYQSYFNIQRSFPLEEQWRGKTDLLDMVLARKTWEFIEEFPLHAAACVSGRKLSRVKFHLRGDSFRVG